MYGHRWCHVFIFTCTVATCWCIARAFPLVPSTGRFLSMPEAMLPPPEGIERRYDTEQHRYPRAEVMARRCYIELYRSSCHIYFTIAWLASVGPPANFPPAHYYPPSPMSSSALRPSVEQDQRASCRYDHREDVHFRGTSSCCIQARA